jgi:cupin fold WbuC family metalloprotein
MTKVFSKIKPNKLLASVLKFSEIKDKRTDICPDEEYVQCSGRILNKDFHVAPHKHKILNRHTDTTQEVWVVLKGKLKSYLYDLDDKFLEEIILEDGDCIAFFRGGHELKVLENDTYFYEIKNGPYHGLLEDKEKLNPSEKK